MMKILAHADSRTAKLVGAFIFWGLFCFAAGNAHVTQEALNGSNRWWQVKEHRDVNAAANHQQLKDLGIVK